MATAAEKMTNFYFHPITEEVQEEVWKKLGTSKQNAKKDIEALKIWLKSQPHLPHTLNYHQIQGFLLLSRGSAEKAKPKIDMYYTIRSLYPDIFKNSHPFCSRMVDVRQFMYIIQIPKLNFDFSRIFILKVKDVPNPSDMDHNAVYAYLFNQIEVRLLEDFCEGHTMIFDLKHCKFQHITQITPTLVRNIYTIGERALTNRVHAVHVINAPKFIDQIILLIKSIVKPKLASKIIVHKDMESVIDSFNKELIPKDYGGNEKSLDELEAAFIKKIEEYKDFFDQRETLFVNESLRPSTSINDDFLGYHGTFKNLDVD